MAITQPLIIFKVLNTFSSQLTPQKGKGHKKEHLSTHTGNQKYCEFVLPSLGQLPHDNGKVT